MYGEERQREAENAVTRKFEAGVSVDGGVRCSPTVRSGQGAEAGNGGKSANDIGMIDVRASWGLQLGGEQRDERDSTASRLMRSKALSEETLRSCVPRSCFQKQVTRDEGQSAASKQVPSASDRRRLRRWNQHFEARLWGAKPGPASTVRLVLGFWLWLRLRVWFPSGLWP
jgi:hypothetical protein